MPEQDLAAGGRTNRQALRLLHAGNRMELRAFTSSGTLVGLFDDLDALAEAAQALSNHETTTGVYITLHELRNDIGVTNRLRRGAGGVKDEDVTCYRFLPVDLDPVRPPDVPSTDKEHAAAEAAGEGLWASLVLDQGWPDPVLMASSGNGVHILWRIDLPVEDKPLVKRSLMALSRQFSTTGVKVDAKVYNPSRIWRLYGTWNRKGPQAPKRAWRRASFIAIPKLSGVVPRKKLEELAGPAELPTTHPQPAADLRPGSRYVEKAVEGELERVLRATPGDAILGRNNSLNIAAFNVGTLVGAGLLEEHIARRALHLAADRVGLALPEAERTINSGLQSGMRQPRRVR